MLKLIIKSTQSFPTKQKLKKQFSHDSSREGKTAEEEMKAWTFWHHRQHSVKQRILDADTKNSMGESRFPTIEIRN